MTLKQTASKETFEQIINNSKIKIEKIISYGDITPEDFWYDQDQDEFVMIIEGFAIIKYEDGTIFELHQDDNLYIPAHQKHKVIYTKNRTIWLAMFIKDQEKKIIH
ncbi:MAG: cupin domain-containing protein [Arcobacteraceae bacterium]